MRKMRKKSINFQKLILSIVQREEEEEEKKVFPYAHTHIYIYIHTYICSMQYTWRNILIMYFLSSGKETLIKSHSWDKCAVRCILKQAIVRTALNANSFRCYFVFTKYPFPPFSGPFDYPAVVPFPSTIKNVVENYILLPKIFI